MKYATHGLGNGLNDLYILPENNQEKEIILSVIKSRGVPLWQWSYSYVKGQSWYGKQFIEIPFAEYLLPIIADAIRRNCKSVDEMQTV